MSKILYAYVKNGKKIIIRNAKVSDANQLINLEKKLAEETVFLMSGPDEINQNIEIQENDLNEMSKNKNGMYLVAVVDNIIIGFLIIMVQDLKRIKHVGNFIIGIEKDYWGIGIAGYLMDAMFKWSKVKGLRRLELDVVEENKRAIEFYKKYDFVIEGKKNEDYYIGEGKYLNTLIMGKKFK